MKTTVRLAAVVMLCSAALMGADAAGKAMFAQKCKACHGAEGQGNPAIAKAMKVTLRPLGSKEVQAKNDADLKKIIQAGSGKMKAVGGVTAEQAADVVAFVRTLKP